MENLAFCECRGKGRRREVRKDSCPLVHPHQLGFDPALARNVVPF